MEISDRIERSRRRNRRKKEWKKWMICAACIFGGAVVAGLWLFPQFSHSGAGSQEGLGGPGGAVSSQDQKEEPPVELVISCVGDIMAHQSQITAQYDSDLGTYQFDNNFQYVKKYIEQADLALCNVETTFNGGKPSGYPLFNSPDQLAQAIGSAGFDVAITANNHMMDTGFSGMQRTLEVLRGQGLAVTGSRLEGDRAYSVSQVKGLKIATVAYTYETPKVNGRRTINGNYLSDDGKALINSFSYSSLDADLESLRKNIEQARGEGADIVICYFHWGEEYQRTPNDWQTTVARKAADMGADIIFASHPHVLQGMEMLTVSGKAAKAGGGNDASQTDGQGKGGAAASPGKEDAAVSGEKDGAGEQASRQVPVFYSMGNFISNQRAETLENRYTEQGMIANVRLAYDKNKGRIVSISMDALPTWVDRFKKGGKYVYSIIPLDSELDGNADLKASGHLARARQALKDAADLLGPENIMR